VGEHVPDSKRGFYTSFIQITATLGLFVSLIVILVTQNSMSKEDFAACTAGAFPSSSPSSWCDLALHPAEDEGVAHLRRTQSHGHDLHAAAEGRLHQVGESEAGADFAFRSDAGQGVVWYTGQFYALFYMQTVF
jgi:hypothetical protein